MYWEVINCFDSTPRQCFNSTCHNQSVQKKCHPCCTQEPGAVQRGTRPSYPCSPLSQLNYQEQVSTAKIDPQLRYDNFYNGYNLGFRPEGCCPEPGRNIICRPIRDI